MCPTRLMVPRHRRKHRQRNKEGGAKAPLFIGGSGEGFKPDGVTLQEAGF